MIWLLPTLFVLVNSPNGQSVRSYEGYDASPEIIQTLLSGEGKTGVFISQKEYEIFNEAHKPPPLVPDPLKEQAKIDLKTKSKSDAERIDALIKYLGI